MSSQILTNVEIAFATLSISDNRDYISKNICGNVPIISPLQAINFSETDSTSSVFSAPLNSRNQAKSEKTKKNSIDQADINAFQYDFLCIKTCINDIKQHMSELEKCLSQKSKTKETTDDCENISDMIDTLDDLRQKWQSNIDDVAGIDDRTCNIFQLAVLIFLEIANKFEKAEIWSNAAKTLLCAATACQSAVDKMANSQDKATSCIMAAKMLLRAKNLDTEPNDQLRYNIALTFRRAAIEFESAAKDTKDIKKRGELYEESVKAFLETIERFKTIAPVMLNKDRKNAIITLCLLVETYTSASLEETNPEEQAKLHIAAAKAALNAATICEMLDDPIATAWMRRNAATAFSSAAVEYEFAAQKAAREDQDDEIELYKQAGEMFLKAAEAYAASDLADIAQTNTSAAVAFSSAAAACKSAVKRASEQTDKAKLHKEAGKMFQQEMRAWKKNKDKNKSDQALENAKDEFLMSDLIQKNAKNEL
ncbi:MAG: hypothetical protein LBI56_02380 [Puniceicoccales bacterium]|jgi:hypothetical protein|nr:hypothetical protein [Puniceicoccales bacterium]